MLHVRNKSMRIVFLILKKGKTTRSAQNSVVCPMSFLSANFLQRFYFIPFPRSPIHWFHFIGFVVKSSRSIRFQQHRHQHPNKNTTVPQHPWILIRIMVNILCAVNLLELNDRKKKEHRLWGRKSERERERTRDVRFWMHVQCAHCARIAEVKNERA